MRILVLSATGTTGRATVDSLLQRDARIRIATRSPTHTPFAEELDCVAFDLLDHSTWEPALSNVQTLYFCLSTALTERRTESLSFLEMAIQKGVKRIVMLSAYRAEYIEYAPHRHIEIFIEQAGVEWIHLRPNFFMENFVYALSPERTLAFPAKQGRISFVAARDIGEMAAEALLGSIHGEIWTLTGPEALSHLEVASTVSKILGESIRYNDIDPERFKQQLMSVGTSLQKAQQLTAVYSQDVAHGEYAYTSQDIPRILGRPAQSLQEWVEEHKELLALSTRGRIQ